MVSTMVSRLARTAQRRAEVQTRQSETSKSVHEHFFAVRRLQTFEVLAKYGWHSNRCSRFGHEPSVSFLESSRSCITNRLYTAVKDCGLSTIFVVVTKVHKGEEDASPRGMAKIERGGNVHVREKSGRVQ